MTDGNVLTAGEGPSRWQVWLEASRPFSFTASVTPVLIGTVLAIMDGHSFWPLLAGANRVAIPPDRDQHDQ